jgi:hypothetical protein
MAYFTLRMARGGFLQTITGTNPSGQTVTTAMPHATYYGSVDAIAAAVRDWAQAHAKEAWGKSIVFVAETSTWAPVPILVDIIAESLDFFRNQKCVGRFIAFPNHMDNVEQPVFGRQADASQPCLLVRAGVFVAGQGVEKSLSRLLKPNAMR